MKEKTKEMPGSQEGDDEFSDIMSQYLLQADQGYSDTCKLKNETL